MKVTAVYDGSPVKAPVTKGEPVGKIVVTAPDMAPIEVPLVAAELPRLNPLGRVAPPPVISSVVTALSADARPLHHLRGRRGRRQDRPRSRCWSRRSSAAGIDALATREPGGSPGAEAIRQLLLDGAPERWDARARRC